MPLIYTVSVPARIIIYVSFSAPVNLYGPKFPSTGMIFLRAVFPRDKAAARLVLNIEVSFFCLMSKSELKFTPCAFLLNFIK